MSWGHPRPATRPVPPFLFVLSLRSIGVCFCRTFWQHMVLLDMAMSSTTCRCPWGCRHGVKPSQPTLSNGTSEVNVDGGIPERAEWLHPGQQCGLGKQHPWVPGGKSLPTLMPCAMPHTPPAVGAFPTKLLLLLCGTAWVPGEPLPTGQRLRSWGGAQGEASAPSNATFPCPICVYKEKVCC